jgi:3-dehydroquinate synthetase
MRIRAAFNPRPFMALDPDAEIPSRGLIRGRALETRFRRAGALAGVGGGIEGDAVGAAMTGRGVHLFLL